MMQKFVIQALEVLLRLLVHQPKPVVIQTIIDDIQDKLKTGKKELSWSVIRKSLDKIVGEDWDTALLLVACVAPGIKQIRTHFDRARQLLGRELDLLVIPEERTSVRNAYRLSDLKMLLRTKKAKKGKLEEVIRARKQFLRNCLDTLTTDVFEPHKMAYYNTASKGIYVDLISTGKTDVADECYQNAFVKFSDRFEKIRPSLYAQYFIRTMRTDLIEQQMGSSGGRVFLPIGVDDDGEPIFDVPADDRYNPETAEKESEAVQTILEALKTAGTRIVKQKALTKKRLRQLYLLFYLASANDERPAYKVIAAKFRVSVDTINKDIADVRHLIADTFEKYDLGLPANALFSKR